MRFYTNELLNGHRGSCCENPFCQVGSRHQLDISLRLSDVRFCFRTQTFVRATEMSVFVPKAEIDCCSRSSRSACLQ
jgi:hypothetical protein